MVGGALKKVSKSIRNGLLKKSSKVIQSSGIKPANRVSKFIPPVAIDFLPIVAAPHERIIQVRRPLDLPPESNPLAITFPNLNQIISQPGIKPPSMPLPHGLPSKPTFSMQFNPTKAEKRAGREIIIPVEEAALPSIPRATPSARNRKRARQIANRIHKREAKPDPILDPIAYAAYMLRMQSKIFPSTTFIQVQAATAATNGSLNVVENLSTTSTAWEGLSVKERVKLTEWLKNKDLTAGERDAICRKYFTKIFRHDQK